MPATVAQSRTFRTSLWWAGLGSAAVAGVDLLSKAVAQRRLPTPSVLTNDELSLGVAGGTTAVLVLLMALGVGVAAVVSCRAIAARRVPWWPVALVLGGAVGNLVDRALHGSVRDFIPAGPVMLNVADIAVLVGMVAAVLAWRGSQPAPNPVDPYPVVGGGDVHV
jgi:signal peptidase II